jgi:membrane protein implicated in regulation of membrane protease activity
MSVESRFEKVWRPLAADIRQAIVGWVVLLAIPVVGALLLTAFVGDVPAWSLALALVVAALLVAAISLEHRRELGRVEGSLGLEQKRREVAEAKVATLERAVPGEPTMSEVQRGLIFRIQALRGQLEARANEMFSTADSQDRAIRNLAVDTREQVRQSETLDDIISEWEGKNPDRSIEDALTALGQLEGLVLSLPLPVQF